MMVLHRCRKLNYNEDACQGAFCSICGVSSGDILGMQFDMNRVAIWQEGEKDRIRVTAQCATATVRYNDESQEGDL